jgi:hypothetical protein
MTVIEIPDEQAAALKAKAAAQGLTLKAWLGKLAEESPAAGHAGRSHPGICAVAPAATGPLGKKNPTERGESSIRPKTARSFCA